ncbi:uncharacterized protein [Halyomorpha halys]|uniref:uncharacterized protein n=1 Tax=Halyomorpha halys TaxID=286706 RepID=UPI0006D4D326|nr:uncharacterized protein LOC106678109 [Halyomorpha halys]
MLLVPTTMKSLLLVLVCSSIVSSSLGIRQLSTDIRLIEDELHNPIDDLWRRALEFIRALLKTYEPFKVPDMPVQTITGDDISLTAKFDNVMISQAENFSIDKIENDILGLWAKFQVTEPTIHLEGDYTVKGTVKGKSVNGNGKFWTDVGNMVTNGYIKVAFKGTYLQMTNFDLDYSIKSLTFNESGLEIEGMTEEEVEALFQTSTFQYFTENEKYVCSQIGAYVIEQANKIMYNKSLQGLLDWLKDFIDGKIVTTPATITI